MKTPPHFRQLPALCLALIALCLVPRTALATTIYQTQFNGSVAWEAEDVFTIANAAPTLWVATNDAPASGGSALYQAGDNKTDASSSFATYAIKFRHSGTYSLYVRWRADKARSDQDPNGGNSYRVGISFGDLANDPTSANFASSSANNTRVPPDANNYAMIKEATTFTVSQQDVDAGTPTLIKIGTREWGMFLDRFVLSLNDALTEAEFNALGNAETDLIPQGPNDDFLAFEAERAARLLTAPPTLWVATNDAPASGGTALYQAGDNKTDSSSSFATYTLKFRAAGTYSLYVRWRADKARSDQDPNGGNSYRVPVTFGDLENDPTSANFASSSANNTRVPPDANNYAMIKEATTFTVSQQDVDAGKPILFKVGTREWGMFLDRFAFSLKDNLTEADFNSLPNSGTVARPSVVKAVGSASLNTITVSFDRGLKPESVIPANFTVTPGLTVIAATLNPATAKDVILTTSAQTAGNSYTVSVSNVTDAQNNAVQANSKVTFLAWKLSEGWVLRELFFGAGTTVADLMANQKFIDNKPDTVEFVRQVAILGELQVANYGARLTTFFVPPQSGAYEFYLYGDDDAELVFSLDEGAGQLQIAIPATTGSTNFDASVSFTSPNLTAGKRYLLQVHFQQGAGAAAVAVGARLKGASGPVDQIPVLGGSSVATYVNPQAGAVTFRQHPASVTVAAFTRARFTVDAVAVSGGLRFYQWQLNGVNIPGATRATYVTPVLGAADTNNRYRCVVSVNGSSSTSLEGFVTVGPGEPGTLQPYVGIQFVGGSPETSPGSPLGAAEVAGVVPQENFNAINGGTVTDQPLVDATGAASPVKLTLDQATTLGVGAGTSSADRALFQGCIKNDNTPLVVRLAQVPAGTYNLVVYSVGFNFNTTYEEDISLEGGAAYPTYYVWAQHAGEYAANPAYLRMNNTNPAGTRDRGNHVVFENIKPAADGSLVLTVTPQSTNVGGATYLPPLNALQLVKVVPVTAKPTLAVATQGANAAISWGAAAAGFRLESSPALGAGATWTAVAGVANPLTGAGNVAVTPAAGARFYRLKQ